MKDEMDTLRSLAKSQPNIDETAPQKMFKSEHLANMRQNRELRKLFSRRIFLFVCGYVSIVVVLLFVCALGFGHLSDTVLATLLGTTTANVIGLFVIVAKYLFRQS